jgi:polysaccharide export outer membrane protein
MMWGIELKRVTLGWVAALICAIAVAGCQPSLKSTLPQGPAAYDSIGGAAGPTATSYLLRPGDKVAVNIFQEEELSQPTVQVDEAGMISLPLIGELQAAGLSTPQLSRAIEDAYGARYLRNPEANVVLVEARPRTVSVEGQVTRPGVYGVEPGYTLLSAMALAGSPSDQAKLDEVLVFRTVDGQRLGGRFDLTEIRSGRMPDPQLVPGDVVVVGFSSLRGLYRDILQLAPLVGTFAVLADSNNN